MLNNKIELFANNFINKDENFVTIEDRKVKLFDKPLIGYGDVFDKEFLKLKDEKIIGEHFYLPTEWFSDGKTVISFFFPFTETVRKSNIDGDWPSREWLHGRIEGQGFLNLFISKMAEFLNSEGGKQLIPSLDERFYLINHSDEGPSFTSNWSERHVAYVCGLGTFGLSKGIITEKGMAGRFCSLITDLTLPITERKYSSYDEYCTYCGRCIVKCPVNAISIEKGKEHLPCSEYNQKVMDKEVDYYGCGKCQVNVPCENRIPYKKKTPSKSL